MVLNGVAISFRLHESGSVVGTPTAYFVHGYAPGDTATTKAFVHGIVNSYECYDYTLEAWSVEEDVLREKEYSGTCETVD